MKRLRTRITALTLALALLLPALAGCGLFETATAIAAEDLTEGLTPRDVSSAVPDAREARALADFALTLYKTSASGEENALVSPLSVLLALAMCANGAQGETLAQMEEIFGLEIDTLNALALGCMESLGDALRLANSIWIKDVGTLNVHEAFLQKNADYYSAGAYLAPFDDGTLRDINNWVKANTGGTIENILDAIPDDAIMYLVNALAFEAEWQSVYYNNQVRDGVFTTEAGEEREIKLMRSTEHRYLEDGLATGVVKYYEGGDYAFVALLPNEGVSVAEYAASLTGDGLVTMLENAESATVEAALPKFELEFSIELSDVLKSMGMTDAFDAELADFTAMAGSDNGNIYISRVLHKTYISVSEKGTKAGAATAVEMASGSAMIEEEIKEVCLDRPFVYMLIDCGTNLPFFIGTVNDIQ